MLGPVAGGTICSVLLPLHGAAHAGHVGAVATGTAHDVLASSCREAFVEAKVLLVVIFSERRLLLSVDSGRSAPLRVLRGSCRVLRVALFALQCQCLLSSPRAARGWVSLYLDSSACTRPFVRLRLSLCLSSFSPSQRLQCWWSVGTHALLPAASVARPCARRQFDAVSFTTRIPVAELEPAHSTWIALQCAQTQQ